MLQAIHLRVTACDWGQQKAIHLKLIADDPFVITLQSVYGCESSDIIKEPIGSEVDNEPKFSAGTVRNSLTSMACASACKRCALCLLPPCSPAPTQRDEASFQLVLGRLRVRVDHHRACGAIER